MTSRITRKCAEVPNLCIRKVINFQIKCVKIFVSFYSFASLLVIVITVCLKTWCFNFQCGKLLFKINIIYVAFMLCCCYFKEEAKVYLTALARRNSVVVSGSFVAAHFAGNKRFGRWWTVGVGRHIMLFCKQTIRIWEKGAVNLSQLVVRDPLHTFATVVRTQN